MRQTDVPFAITLANEEGWGTPARDYERLLKLNPAGCVVAELGHERVGIATATTYGRKIAWIGNVVVKKKYRGRHVGKQLVQHLLNYLSHHSVEHVALYSFKENFRFYRKLGFVYGPQFVRLRRERRSPVKHLLQTSKSEPMAFSSLLAIDAKAFGVDRRRLLRLIIESGFAWYEAYRFGSSESYAMVKQYADMYELGPSISFGLARQELNSFLGNVLNKTVRKPTEVSCPTSSRSAIAVLKSLNFREINRGRVMYHRQLSKIGRPEAIVAHGFLDKG